MLCANIWDTGIWSHEWKHQELVMLYKNGNNKECRNYKTSSLISHTTKILLEIILNRLHNKSTEEFLEEQTGFWKDWGIADFISALQIMIEKLTDTKKTAFITFLITARPLTV